MLSLPFRRIAKRILFACRSRHLYALCRQYVDLYDGDNQDDMLLNGEDAVIRDIIPSCRIVFDVGANVGDWTCRVLKVNSRVKVHCFEPCRSTFAMLTVARLPRQVTCNNFALGDCAQEVQLHVEAAGSGTNSFYARAGAGVAASRTEPVQVDTIDAYCRKFQIDRIDFLKIDVEGHELAVLRGAREMLSRQRISWLQFEYGGTYIDARLLLKDVWEYLLAVAPACRFFKLYSNGPRPVRAYRQSYENFQCSNWLVVIPASAGAGDAVMPATLADSSRFDRGNE